ncbi:MAG TPA: amidohydrolase family protein [Gemmatimonadaceae bacterium]
MATAAALAVIPISPVSAQTKVLRFKAVVVGDGSVVPNGVIFVDGDRIMRVMPWATDRPLPTPSGAEIIDLARYTAIPGLIDVHTHVTYSWDPESGTDPWRQPSKTKEQLVVQAKTNLFRTLESGVTTIRDLGASRYADVALRDSVAKGGWTGPRLFVAGWGLSKRRLSPDSSLESIRRFVKTQADSGADYIKVYGSTGSGADVTGVETFTLSEMQAAVDAARAAGKPIAIHSYGPDGARDAVRAGATTVEHAIDIDDATLAEMVRRGTYYVPTIDHNRYYAEYAKDFRYTPAQVAALDSFRLRNIETARRAFKAGVKFGMGSDAVFHMFGQNTRELGWYVQVGMTPAQALATATANGAAILGMEKSLGKLAPGYFADIVAVEGDPLADIGMVINGVKWVMKSGAVVVDKPR